MKDVDADATMVADADVDATVVADATMDADVDYSVEIAVFGLS